MKPKWKRRWLGNHYEWMLSGQHPTLVTALVQHGEILNKESPLELRIILDPRTGKPWTNMKRMRDWLNETLR